MSGVEEALKQQLVVPGQLLPLPPSEWRGSVE